MKCYACGYEYKKEIVDKAYVTTKGDSAFINIRGMFRIDQDGGYGSDKEADLVACPKCGSIILQDYILDGVDEGEK